MKPSGESTGEVPARAGAADGVEGEAGDHHPGVFGVGVDGDPLARAGFAPGLQAGRVERAFEEAAAVQGEADRARAVIAGGFEGAVAAAPDVGGGGDRVGGRDRRLTAGRRRGGGARLAFGDEAGGLARGQRRRDFAGRDRAAFGGDLGGDRGEVVAQRLFAGLRALPSPARRWAWAAFSSAKRDSASARAAATSRSVAAIESRAFRSWRGSRRAGRPRP